MGLEASASHTALLSHTLRTSTIHVAVLGLDVATSSHDALRTSVCANRVQTTLHRPRKTHREIVRRQLPSQRATKTYNVGKETVAHELLELVSGIHSHLVNLLLLLHALLRKDRQRVRQSGTGSEFREGKRDLRQLQVRCLFLMAVPQYYNFHLVDAVRQLERVRNNASLREKDQPSVRRDDTSRNTRAGHS